MSPSKTPIQPCRASRHGVASTPVDRVALAQALCDERGLRLTAVRRQVLELLLECDRPAGAYELIEQLKIRNSRSVNPPTVYRALDFLMSQGFVSRIESDNAYVPCAHPERRHDCVCFVCSDCGESTELEDPRIEQLLAEDAADLGFSVSRPVIEIKGTCASCLTSGANETSRNGPLVT